MKPRLFAVLVVITLLLVSNSTLIVAADQSAGVVGESQLFSALPTPTATRTKAPTQPPVRSAVGQPTPIPTNAALDAATNGRWPAQLVGSTGNVSPSRNGPQRTDPREGTPKHAYSPFDERNNREYPCPPGGCDFQKGRVLVKLASQSQVRSPNAPGAWTANATVNSALSAQGVLRLEPIFPQARAPRAGERVTTPQGESVPKPDLTTWHRAVLQNQNADIYGSIQALSRTPGILSVEPDYLRKPIGDPLRLEKESSVFGNPGVIPPALPGPSSDPLYSQQWHLTAVNAPQAWSYLESQGLPPGGNRNIIVAVIDTGVDYNHPDLAANIWTNSREIPGNGIDDDGNGFVDDAHGVDVITNSGNPMDDHGHGTHVAGIIAAQGNNGAGGVGVAYNVQLMPIKAAQYSGVLASSDIAEAIYYAVAQGADVINMSFGGYARSQVEEDALAVAFGQAVLVAAAGNDGKVNLPCPLGRDMYPAAYNWVLGIMARNPSPNAKGDYLAGFSNYDCAPRDSHEYELMAPGAGILSTLPNDQYAAWAGTSMAAPIVSGIAALVRTKFTDKDVYSSRFIMGQIATTGATMQAYTPQQGDPVSYQVPDAYAALTTFPKPRLSYLEHWLFDTAAQSSTDDNDGIVDAGETIDLAIVIRNHWGKADQVSVKLEAIAGVFGPDPYVTIITGTVDYGAVGSFNIDDNGLIYDSQGAITGVHNPFRFRTDPNTPNDHLIPFRLTMTARNGLDPNDTSTYSFESSFNLIVQRGRELPHVISQDMTLTKDSLWLVPDRTLIQSGVTVTVTEGTQIQFWSANPSTPYVKNARPLLQVEGTLTTGGTSAEPVEMFTGASYIGYPIVILQVGNGAVELRYARVMNPIVGNLDPFGTSGGGPLDLIDHSYFGQDFPNCIYGYDSFYDTWRCWTAPRVDANTISHSIFRRTGYVGYMTMKFPLLMNSRSIANLYDSVLMTAQAQVVDGNAFLLDYQAYTDMFGGRLRNEASRADNPGYSCDACDPSSGRANNQFRNNAILNVWWDADPSRWMRFYASSGRNVSYYATDNFWATSSSTLIDAAIQDFNDDFNLGHIVYQPILTTPPATAYPFVVDVVLSTASSPRTSIVGAERVTFTVTFNRDMDTSTQPLVSFGPDVPDTDYTVHPINGGWQNAHTWSGTFNINPITGDGYQLIRVAGARAADDPWLVTGDDSGRFRFEIITSGTEAMNLQANGGEGHIDLSWTQNDFDLLAGFNLYRATTITGTTYSRVNTSIVPPSQRSFQDPNVQPGQPYYYKFTVVKSDMSESDFSNVATATPLDTIPPAITHTPVTSAPPGLALTLFADVTDNVGVQGVKLYSRGIGATTYFSSTMTHTTGNRYSATIDGSRVTSPGLEYYIEATDGVSTVRNGRAEYPNQIVVMDRPVVTVVSPNRGPMSGGTLVTIAGSNFKTGATVTFGGAIAGNITVLSTTQITATTPAHFPSVVDVIVTNTDTQSGTLLRGFTFESDVVSLSLPNTGGGQHALVEIPLNGANIQGLAAADLIVTFDSAVLRAAGGRPGTLTPGWSVAANTTTAGQVRLSMASPGGTVSGSGSLALLDFEVMGSPAMTSTLRITNASLNDGAIPATATDGSFTVNQVYGVSGNVRFWNGNSPIPSVTLTLDGDRLYSASSSATGAYTVTGVLSGTYTLAPSKSDGINGISAYDASLALQHAAGLITLTGDAATAADVNKSGAITSMDAFYILQKSVDLISLPFPGAGVVWQFNPVNRAFANLNSNQPNQDFTGILLGDVSGNWSAGAHSPSLISSSSNSPTIKVQGGTVSSDGTVTVTVWLDPAKSKVYSLDLVLSYDATRATPLSAELGSSIGEWLLSANLRQPGQVRLALAGASAIPQAGAIITLRFRLSEPRRTTALEPTRGDINEGIIPAQLVGAPLYGSIIHLPIVGR